MHISLHLIRILSFFIVKAPTLFTKHCMCFVCTLAVLHYYELIEFDHECCAGLPAFHFDENLAGGQTRQGFGDVTVEWVMDTAIGLAVNLSPGRRSGSPSGLPKALSALSSSALLYVGSLGDSAVECVVWIRRVGGASHACRANTARDVYSPDWPLLRDFRSSLLLMFFCSRPLQRSAPATTKRLLF